MTALMILGALVWLAYLVWTVWPIGTPAWEVDPELGGPFLKGGSVVNIDYAKFFDRTCESDPRRGAPDAPADGPASVEFRYGFNARPRTLLSDLYGPTLPDLSAMYRQAARTEQGR